MNAATVCYLLKQLHPLPIFFFFFFWELQRGPSAETGTQAQHAPKHNLEIKSEVLPNIYPQRNEIVLSGNVAMLLHSSSSIYFSWDGEEKTVIAHWTKKTPPPYLLICVNIVHAIWLRWSLVAGKGKQCLVGPYQLKKQLYLLLCRRRTGRTKRGWSEERNQPRVLMFTQIV